MRAKVIHTYPLAWEGITPEATITITKEVNDEGELVRYRASTPNVAELEPRYGETRPEAIQAMQRVLWKYHSSGNDIAEANKEK